MNENEEWRDIPNYEGLYQVSSLGKVKSLRDRYGNPREKMLKFERNRGGYLLTFLCKNGKKKTFSVHRLVANAFIDNPSNLPQVNHKDENKENNQASNLEWCTQKYNLNYGSRITKAVANTDYKAIASKIDYKARTAKIDYKSIGTKNAEKLTNRQDLSKQVYQYTLDGELVAIWESTAECGRNGYNFGNVAACCRNCFNREGNNVYKNFIWSYTELKK